ncbi:DMT family transporter [Roseovarius sp. MMSF_3281]|uniref:DMT family transporter n=1 Tax=Roseovarius sp. MMSF_3281 TaxID=3046694 RepID=UPI0027402CA1|nr:DMT family transporter [Roseovarius sp. MMSF_3281]
MPKAPPLAITHVWMTLFMVVPAMFCIVAGDTAGKALTQAGAHPFFVAWARFAMAALVLLPLSGLSRDELPKLLGWRILLRGALVVGGIASILTALSTEPIADVFGAFFVGPIISYILAALLLKEHVTPARSLLLVLGFAGVLLVVKPGFGAGLGMGFAVLAGVFYGSFLTATRWLAGHFRPRFLLISQLLVGSVLLAPLALAVGAPAMTPQIWLLLIGSAAGSAMGNFLLAMATRSAPASVIAPLVYTQLIAATLLGYLAFGDWPDALSLTGLAVILTSGLLSLRLARR